MAQREYTITEPTFSCSLALLLSCFLAFLEMGNNIQTCTYAVNLLANTLREYTNIDVPAKITHHCFRITLPSGQVVSVSVPPDANAHLTMETLESAVFETALVGNDGHLTYSKELGYDDIQRFYSQAEVFNELIRLIPLTLIEK